MAHKLQADYPNIKETAHYLAHSTGKVHTGLQVLNLLEVAKPVMQAIILMDIEETDAPADKPDSKYGL